MAEAYRYYGFVRDDGSVDGIFRVSQAESLSPHFENGVTGEWVTDQSLLGDVSGINGATDAAPIDLATARKQAARYGVEL